MDEFRFITYDKDDDGLTKVNGNVNASIEWLKLFMTTDKQKKLKKMPGGDTYCAMISWLKLNHPEKLL